MTKVRAKFTCKEVNFRRLEYTEQTEVKLEAVKEGEFWKATPIGQLTMTITNKSAYAFFEPGVDYHLDFSVAEEEGEPQE